MLAQDPTACSEEWGSNHKTILPPKSGSVRSGAQLKMALADGPNRILGAVKAPSGPRVPRAVSASCRSCPEKGGLPLPRDGQHLRPGTAPRPRRARQLYRKRGCVTQRTDSSRHCGASIWGTHGFYGCQVHTAPENPGTVLLLYRVTGIFTPNLFCRTSLLQWDRGDIREGS